MGTEPVALASSAPLVDVGWVVAPPIEAVDRAAVEIARARVEAWLSRVLPEFRWNLTLTDRPDAPGAPRLRPIVLVELGAFERSTRSRDFVFVVTGADLEGLYRRFALAATSRCEAVAVASTLRLDPAEGRGQPDEAVRRERIASRLATLFLRCLVILNGLHPSRAETGTGETEAPDDLDVRVGLCGPALDALRERLGRVADLRVEEAASRPRRRFAFYLRALRADPRAVPEMVLWARPWLLPVRLGRMSAAALSVLFVLMMTAEAWELGVSRTLGQVLGLAVGVLVATTALVVRRQSLWVRSAGRETEQTALSNLATVFIVGLGLASTLCLLVLIALVAGLLVFDGPVVEGWSVETDGLELGERLVFSAFASAIAIVAGALGASFEEAEDFHHIARVDREL